MATLKTLNALYYGDNLAGLRESIADESIVLHILIPVRRGD